MLSQAKEQSDKLSESVARALSVNAALKHGDAVGARRAFSESLGDAEAVSSMDHISDCF